MKMIWVIPVAFIFGIGLGRTMIFVVDFVQAIMRDCP